MLPFRSLVFPLGLVGTPSSSTGALLIDGVFVSMKGVRVATAGDVLCGKEPVRWTGEIVSSGAGASAGGGTAGAASVGGDTVLGSDSVMAVQSYGVTVGSK